MGASEAVAMACEAELQERTAGAAYEAEQGCHAWSTGPLLLPFRVFQTLSDFKVRSNWFNGSELKQDSIYKTKQHAFVLFF